MKSKERTLSRISKKIVSLSGKHDPQSIWSDYLEINALSIQNAIAPRDEVWKKREEKYAAIIKKYDAQERDGLAELAAIVIEEMTVCANERKYVDVLGNAHMELSANLHLGQVFTPQHLANAMAKMAMENIEKDMEEKGHVNIADFSVGGGACLLGAINALTEHKIDWQRRCLFIGQDLDERCIHQAYIQLSLYGAQAIFKRGNSLEDPFRFEEINRRDDCIWRTPTHENPLMFGMCHAWRMQPIEKAKEESVTAPHEEKKGIKEKLEETKKETKKESLEQLILL